MIEIVKLRPNHLNLLLNFFTNINTDEYRQDFSPFVFNSVQAKRICTYQGKDQYYGIILNNADIIGIGMLRGWDEGYDVPAIGLCILKSYQGMGLGTMTLSFLESVARVRGCLKIMLKVKKDNEKAIKLYTDMGYLLKDHNEEYLIGFKDIPSAPTVEKRSDNP